MEIGSISHVNLFIRPTHEVPLVVLSVVIAVIASYTALDLAGRVTSAQGRVRQLWFTGGAMAMGIGIWSMHFIAMLAYHLPIAVSYNPWIVLISLVVAIISSGSALFVVSRQKMGWLEFTSGGIFMGLGVSSMHYTGMSAMRLEVIIQYDPKLATLSVVIAIGASLSAVWLGFHLRTQNAGSGILRKLVSAIFMGNAIAGMHYTAMAAVSFKPTDQAVVQHLHTMNTLVWAVAISSATFIVLSLTLLISLFDQRLSAEAASKIEVLAKSEERFRSLVQNSSDMISILEDDGNIRYISSSVKQVLGYEPEDLVGKNILNYLHPEDATAFQVAFASVIQAPETAFHIEERFRHTSGSWVYLESISNNLLNNLNVLGVVLNSRDITERKRAEESLRKSEELFRSVVEHAIEAIEITDAEARFEYVNPAFEKITGYTSAEVLGKTPAVLLRSGRQDAAFYQAMSNTLASGQVWSDCYIGKRKDGSLYHQEVTISPVLNSAGVVIHHVAVKRDVTERQQAESALRQAEQKYRSIFENAVVGIFQTTQTGYYISANPALARIYGYESPEELITSITNIDRQLYVDSHRRLEFVALMQKHDGLFKFESQVYRQNGSVIWISENARVVRDTDGTFLYYEGFVLDITEIKKTEAALRESEERFALAVQGTNDGLWDWNLKANKVYFSPRWKSMLGFEESEIGSNLDEWFKHIHPEDIERVKVGLAKHLEGLTPDFESEYRMLYKDGTFRWMLSRGLAVWDVNGQASRMAGSQTDITQRKLSEEKLLHDAFHDSLTGLPNRALFMDRLGHAVERVKRHEDSLFAVLFIDLDRFKVINDSLGHMSGDQLLITVVKRLKHCLRSGDTLARLGGDEFTILLEDIKDISEATSIAEQIQERLTSPFGLSGHEVFISASIGIVLSTTGYEQLEDLLRDADTAMYRAKAQGKACYQVFDKSMHIRAVTLLQLENDLRRAIMGTIRTVAPLEMTQEFRVYYQPIVSLATGRMNGFEALVRWQHPTRGLVSPTEFIPIAEETGLIVPLGYWVLHSACCQMRGWQERFPTNPPLTISVNLSSKQFLQPDLIEQIDQILRETGLDACSLRLEVTESAIMENAETAAQMLLQLRNLGIQIYLDDFGTGYSSLSYLQRFPVNALKIDRSFVSSMGVNGEDLDIVQTIVMLAHKLGVDVVAEGVETAEQLAQLKALCCTNGQGQGYFFSKPLNSEAAEALIAGASIDRNLGSISN